MAASGGLLLRISAQTPHLVEAHYAFMESSLGQSKLSQLYRLLDEVIGLECPPLQPSEPELLT